MSVAPPEAVLRSTVQAPSTLSLPPTGFVRLPQVLALVPVSKSTFWRHVSAGTFPAPVKLSLRVTAWRVEDIRDWIAEKSTS